MEMINNVKMYRIDEVAEILNLSRYTIANWYAWETKLLKTGEVTEAFLPKFTKVTNMSGRPKFWSEDAVEALKKFKNEMVMGRHGKFGKFTNPQYIKKSQKSLI